MLCTWDNKKGALGAGLGLLRTLGNLAQVSLRDVFSAHQEQKQQL